MRVAQFKTEENQGIVTVPKREREREREGERERETVHFQW